MLVFLFIVPVMLAVLLAFGYLSWLPGGRVNHGMLIDPALPLHGGGSGGPSRADWHLAALVTGGDAGRSAAAVAQAARIRQALGRNAARVRVHLIENADTRSARAQRGRDPAVERWWVPAEALRALTRALSARLASAELLDGALLLADSELRVVLVYPHPPDGHGALEDLERLIRAAGDH
jgi:hypothetical protein